MNEMPDSLLAADEPAPVTVHNENGLSPFLIVADHAGNCMPRALGRLGISETDCERHIAWDIGIAAVSRLVADALDATLVQQNYSRLVIDCNRAPGSEESIPEISERTPVPGNIGLSEGGKAARVREIFRPYHDRIESELDRRRQAGRPAALIAMHSFTPVFMGVARPAASRAMSASGSGGSRGEERSEPAARVGLAARGQRGSELGQGQLLLSHSGYLEFL
jgi:predicted N-formylglutamate amidohydrolase